MNIHPVLRLAGILPLVGAATAVGDSFVVDAASPSVGGAPDVWNDPLPSPPGLSLAALGLVPGDRIDAMSDGNDPLNVLVHGHHDHLFSVARAAVGDTGTGVEAERLSDTAPPGGVNGHPADIFLHIHGSASNVLAPASTGLGWSAIGGDETNAGLVTTVTIPPGDDVVAYELTTMSSGGTPPSEVYFSLAPGSPTLATLGAGPADILAVGGAFGAGPVIFATEASLLIGPGPGFSADIDALSLEVSPGVPAPTLVRAQFSMTAASATGWTTSNGDIVDSGALVILYDPSVPVSLVAHTPAELGLLANDELDALEATFYMPPPPTPPDFDFQALPELSGGASRANGLYDTYAGGLPVVIGEAREAQGNWRAVIWEDTGAGFQASVLPAIDPTMDGKGNDVLVVSEQPVVCVVGASENGGGNLKPVAWERQGAQPWNMTVLPQLGGQEGEDFAVGIGSSGMDSIVSVGWSTDPAGIQKAVAWMSDDLGGWTIVALPELPGPQGRAGRAYDVTIVDDEWAGVVGGSEDQMGRTRPVLWQELPGGGFVLIELPLLEGDEGEAVAVSDCTQSGSCGFRPAGGTQPVIVGWSNDTSGNRHSVRWESADGQWIVEDLATLQGLVSSQANGIHDAPLELQQTIVGVSDNGAGLNVATIWMTSGGPAIAVDLNDLVSLPQTVALRDATGIVVGSHDPGLVQIAGWFTARGGAAPVGTRDSHAFLLTSVSPAIPTISQWGAAIMVLLVLASGTIVFGRRRRALGAP